MVGIRTISVVLLFVSASLVGCGAQIGWTGRPRPLDEIVVVAGGMRLEDGVLQQKTSAVDLVSVPKIPELAKNAGIGTEIIYRVPGEYVLHVAHYTQQRPSVFTMLFVPVFLWAPVYTAEVIHDAMVDAVPTAIHLKLEAGNTYIIHYDEAERMFSVSDEKSATETPPHRPLESLPNSHLCLPAVPGKDRFCTLLD